MQCIHKDIHVTCAIPCGTSVWNKAGLVSRLYSLNKANKFSSGSTQSLFIPRKD